MSQCDCTNRGYIPCFTQKVEEWVKLVSGLEGLDSQEKDAVRRATRDVEVSRDEAVRESTPNMIYRFCERNMRHDAYVPVVHRGWPYTYYTLCLPARLFDQVVPKDAKGEPGSVTPENIDVVLSKTREVIGKTCGE